MSDGLPGNVSCRRCKRRRDLYTSALLCGPCMRSPEGSAARKRDAGRAERMRKFYGRSPWHANRAAGGLGPADGPIALESEHGQA